MCGFLIRKQGIFCASLSIYQRQSLGWFYVTGNKFVFLSCILDIGSSTQKLTVKCSRGKCTKKTLKWLKYRKKVSKIIWEGERIYRLERQMKGLKGPICVCFGRGSREPETLDCMCKMTQWLFRLVGWISRGMRTTLTLVHSFGCVEHIELREIMTMTRSFCDRDN